MTEVRQARSGYVSARVTPAGLVVLGLWAAAQGWSESQMVREALSWCFAHPDPRWHRP